MKKVIKLSLVISLVGMFLASCSSPSVIPSHEIITEPSASRLAVPGYYSDTEVTNLESAAELVYNEEINDIFFFEYKIGSIKNCFIQSLFNPIYNDGNIQKMTFTASDITSESISKGVTNSVSVTNTTSVTNTQSTTNIDWKFTLEVPKDTVTAITKMATLEDPKSALSLGASGTINKTTNTTSQTITESLTKSSNESHDITSFNQKCKQVSYDFDFTKYETGKYYTLGLIANIDVYQVIAYDKVENRFYASYFYTDINENNTAIKVLSSDNLEFELPEEVKIHPISSLSINTTIVGDGTFTNPYLVCTPIQFAKIQTNPSASFKLNKDIDFGDAALQMISEFSGELDGNGHAIYNFHITGNKKDGLALFYNNKGTIKNLQVGKSGYDTYITNDYKVSKKDDRDGASAIFSVNNNGSITNCLITNSKIVCAMPAAITKNNYGVINKVMISNNVLQCNYGGSVIGAIASNESVACYICIIDNVLDLSATDFASLLIYCGGGAAAVITENYMTKIYDYCYNTKGNDSFIVSAGNTIKKYNSKTESGLYNSNAGISEHCVTVSNSVYSSLISLDPAFDSVVDSKGRRVWRADENGKISLTFYNLD